MTPFAQLGNARPMTKSAMPLLRAVKSLATKGLWSRAAEATGKRMAAHANAGTAAGRGLRAADWVSRQMSGGLGSAAGYYGMAGMVSPMVGGPELPGSNLALNIGMPGLAALYGGAGAITAVRTASKKNQEKMLQDGLEGAREAGSHLISGINADPSMAYGPGRYLKFLEDNGIDTSGARGYMSGNYRPLSWWERAGALFDNPQALIDDQIDKRIHGFFAGGGMSKRAGIPRLVWDGAKKLLPWLWPTMAVGSVAHAALRDKPYDVSAVQQKGYSAATAALQQRLNGMGWMERMALRMDPTLAVRSLEQHLPGSIAAWERGTGSRYNPGFLSNMADTWQNGSKPRYFSYDAAGNRNYIPDTTDN